MWRSCIKTKYGSQNRAGSLFILEVAMELVLEVYCKKRLKSLRKIVFKLGDDRKIIFWEDTWRGRQPLCDAFRDLYSISDSKGAKALEIWVRGDGGGARDPKFMRSFNDWEMVAVQEFIGVTSNIKISPLEKDKLSWKGDESGSFKVKACFKELEGASPHKVLPCKMLWN